MTCTSVQVTKGPVKKACVCRDRKGSNSFTLFWACCIKLLAKFVPLHRINPLNAKLNTIYHLLTLLGARHILHISRIRVKSYVGEDVSLFAFLNSALHGYEGSASRLDHPNREERPPSVPI